MTISSSVLLPTILIPIVFGIVYARRIATSYYGAPLRVTRLVIWAALVVGIFLLIVVPGYVALPEWSLPSDAVVLCVAAVVTIGPVERRVTIERVAPDRWTYRLPIVVPLVYLVLFVTRALLGALVLDVSPFAVSPVPAVLSPPPWPS